MKKKIVIYLGIITFINLLIIGSVNALNNQELEKEIIKNNSFERKLAQKIDSLLKNELDGEYPKYYGGMYISDDSLKLIVQVTKNKNDKLYAKQAISMIKTMQDMDDSIQIEYVDNSYVELNTVNNNIIDYFLEKDNTHENWVGNYIDVYQNAVIVELKDDSLEQQEIFKKKVIDSNLIKFVQSDGNMTTSSTLKAGQAIYTKLFDDDCSVGYRVKISGKEGYITAGHCFKGLNDKIPTGIVKRYQFSGSIDAAFVEVNSSYTVSNYLAYHLLPILSVHVETKSFVTPVGTKVAKSGNNTHYTSGKIVSNNYTANLDGVTLTNMISTDVKADGGDSGGPVFLTDTNAGAVIGIVSGRKRASTNSMFYTLESNIFGTFKYTAY